MGKIEEAIDGLNRSFDKLRELKRIVENRRQTGEQWRKRKSALEDPINFLEKINKAINKTRQIYDKGAEGGAT